MKLASNSGTGRAYSQEEIKALKELASSLSDDARAIASFVSSIKNSDVTRLIASDELMKKLTELDGSVDKAKDLNELNALLGGSSSGTSVTQPSQAELQTVEKEVGDVTQKAQEQAAGTPLQPTAGEGKLMKDIIKKALNDAPPMPVPDSPAAAAPPPPQEDNSLVAILNTVNLGQFVDAMQGKNASEVISRIENLKKKLDDASQMQESEALFSYELRAKSAAAKQSVDDSVQAITDMKKQINVVLQALKSFMDFAKTNSPSQPLQSLQTNVEALISGINDGTKDPDAQ